MYLALYLRFIYLRDEIIPSRLKVKYFILLSTLLYLRTLISTFNKLNEL